MPLLMQAKGGSEKATFMSGERSWEGRRNYVGRGDFSLHMLAYLFYVSIYLFRVNKKKHFHFNC